MKHLKLFEEYEFSKKEKEIHKKWSSDRDCIKEGLEDGQEYKICGIDKNIDEIKKILIKLRKFENFGGGSGKDFNGLGFWGNGQDNYILTRGVIYYDILENPYITVNIKNLLLLKNRSFSILFESGDKLFSFLEECEYDVDKLKQSYINAKKYDTAKKEKSKKIGRQMKIPFDK